MIEESGMRLKDIYFILGSSYLLLKRQCSRCLSVHKLIVMMMTFYNVIHMLNVVQ